MHVETETTKPGTERVQALADISRSPYMLSCAPIANPPNNAQLGGTPYRYPKLHPGPCSMGKRPRTDRQTDRRHRRAWPL